MYDDAIIYIFVVELSMCSGICIFEVEFQALDIRLQVEVKDQNMIKHPLGIYHRISALYADHMMNSVGLCISYGKFPRDA